jgi:hypothetical protein
MTTYLGHAATEKLAAAQAVIDRHLVSCGRCGTDRPCLDRAAAEEVFTGYLRLPQRTPGLTRSKVPGNGPARLAG